MEMEKTELIDMKDLKKDVSDNELLIFCDSLANNSATKYNYTIDYFDTQIGVLYSKETPTCLSFCVALLREILCNLDQSHELWDKIKYAAFLLNLATRNQQFSVFYDIFHKIEVDIVENKWSWTDREVAVTLDKNVSEKLADLENNETKYNIEMYSFPADPDEDPDPPLNGLEAMLFTDYEEQEDSKANVVIKKKKRAKRKALGCDDTGNGKSNSGIKKTKRKLKPRTKTEDGVKKAPRNKVPTEPCHLCDFKSVSKEGLEKHTIEKHGINKLCTQCGHLSETFKDFLRHNETHTVTCEVCSMKIPGLKVLKTHMKTHETKQETTPSSLEESEKAPCTICGVMLKKTSLNFHRISVHSNEVHKCDICDFTTKTKLKLTYHRSRHFAKMHSCPECGVVVKNLKAHFYRKCGKKQVRHSCHLCEKSFTEKHSLARHIRTVHQKILNFHCNVCDYKTSTTFNLRMHVSKMHTKEDMKKVCMYCNQETSNLEYHIKIYHCEDQLREQKTNSTEIQDENE